MKWQWEDLHRNEPKALIPFESNHRRIGIMMNKEAKSMRNNIYLFMYEMVMYHHEMVFTLCTRRFSTADAGPELVLVPAVLM